LHQAVRILIQLGTVELLGRLAHVPYEQCLMGETVQADALPKAQDGFDGLDEAGRIRYAQQKLAGFTDAQGRPYYAGAVDGKADGNTRDAIAHYQKDAGLIATGQIDLDFYRSLQHRPADLPKPAAAPRLSLQTAPGANLKQGGKLALSLSADRDAHAQCFLKTRQGQMLRIFPNAEQPDDRLAAGTALLTPQPGATRQILLDEPGEEQIGCLVSVEQFKTAPPPAPLGTTPLSADSLEDAAAYYRREAGGMPVGIERLRVTVQ
jgi:peptidoglycan hydrolase-like protein with peptidoglycan-binding domain